MFRKRIMIGILLIMPVASQGAQEVSILGYGSRANITCDLKTGHGPDIWTKPIAGGMGVIWKASNNIEVEGTGLSFVPEYQMHNKGSNECWQSAKAFNVILRLQVPTSLTQAFTLGNDNFYGAVGLVGVIPSLDHHDHAKNKRDNITLDMAMSVFIGGGYKHHLSNRGVFDVQAGGLMKSVSTSMASIDCNWIVKAGVGIRIL